MKRSSGTEGMTRRGFLGFSAVASAAILSGCSIFGEQMESVEEAAASGDEAAAQLTGILALDSAAWNYDADHNVYWQAGVRYCETPEAPDYESLSIFVPGSYFAASDNGDGTFTCVPGEGTVAGFTTHTAPIVMPVNTAGYSAQRVLEEYNYEDIAEYLNSGFVYVYAGCRGRDNGYDSQGNLQYSGGAPWGVTDLKAAVRYLRYNNSFIPGDTERIIAFGHSGGGAQSAILGASGDSELYLPYLASIGAALEDDEGNALSDSVFGVMSWCPITCLDQADAAYEWMMGQFADTGSREDGTWTSALSKDLASRFAEYINETGFADADGNKLSLDASIEGTYLKGSYYNYLMGLINESLNNFLSDTKFPYTPSLQEEINGGLDPNAAERLSNNDSASEKATDNPTEKKPDDEGTSGGAPPSNDPKRMRDETSGTSDQRETIYETVEDYISALNNDGEWIFYDTKTKSALVDDMGAFVRHCKPPSKDVGVFDSLDRSTAENMLFGNDESDALHFDTWMAQLLSANAERYAQLKGWNEAYASDFASDVEQPDTMGSPLVDRANMYNPLYYVCGAYDGVRSSRVAPHWRIHSGIRQVNTPLTTEANLALALQSNENVESVEFITVWEQGHTTAERAGVATENAIAWIKSLFMG